MGYKSKLKLSPLLEQVCPVPENEKYMPWLQSPPSLVEMASEIVNQLPMPDCWNWDSDQVATWLIFTVELPQYKDCFLKNFINGRRLLLVDSSVCPKIGIRDFSHIKKIQAHIRKLYNSDKERFKRSISLPPRYPLTHYLLYQIPTGPKRENTTRSQLFRKMNIVDQEKPCPFGHWEMIESSQPDFPYNRFGLIFRKNVYEREENFTQPRGNSYLRRSKTKSNYFLRIDVK